METKPFIDAAEVVIQNLRELAKEYGEKALQEIKDGKFDLREHIKSWAYPELAKANIVPIQVEYLSKDKLVSTIKENKIPNSNEVAALLRKGEKKVYLYTAFVKDGELIPVENNKYLVFVSDAIARDLESLFDGKELIVLR